MLKKTLIFAFCLILLPVISPAKSPEYEKARKCYLEEAGPKGSKKRDFEKCINLFIQSAKGADEESALYSIARLNKEAYYRFDDTKFRDDSVKYYNEVINKFPKGNLAPDSLYRIGCLRQDDFKDLDKAKTAFNYLIENYKDSKLVPSSKDRLIQIAEMEKSQVAKKTDVIPAQVASDKITAPLSFKGGEASRHTPAVITWAKTDNSENIEFKFTSDKIIKYTYYKEPEGLRTKSPPKLIIDFPHTSLEDSLAKKVPINSKYVSNVKFKENIISNRLTAIFEMDKSSSFEVTKSNNDIIVKIGNLESKNITNNETLASKQKGKPARQVKIMIDPGHGGEDSGAIGPNGTKEKDIVLSIAKILKRDLEKKLGAQVKLTRTSDKSLTLDQRNRIAEKWKADLFISLHVNAAINKEAKGFETYYLNNTTDKASIKMAERENKYSGKSLQDVDKIVLTMLQNYNAEESRALARSIQKKLVKTVSSRYSDIEDKGVKSALFYVLVGAKCPGVLVESSFISNKLEEKRLRQKEYQSLVSIGILNGIEDFLNNNPTENI